MILNHSINETQKSVYFLQLTRVQQECAGGFGNSMSALCHEFANHELGTSNIQPWRASTLSDRSASSRKSEEVIMAKMDSSAETET